MPNEAEEVTEQAAPEQASGTFRRESSTYWERAQTNQRGQNVFVSEKVFSSTMSVRDSALRYSHFSFSCSLLLFFILDSS